MFSIDAAERLKRSPRIREFSFDILVGKVKNMELQTGEGISGISKIKSLTFYIKGQMNDEKYMMSGQNKFSYINLDTEDEDNFIFTFNNQ